MQRFTVVALLLLCTAVPVSLAAKEKAKPVDMKDINRIFVGWVDINQEDWKMQGYASRKDWLDVISNANSTFQQRVIKSLAGRTVTAAKDKDDAAPAGNDLYIKFSDARVDKKYQLHIAVHFIDLKTNNEVGSIPLESYSAHFCSLSSCIDKELDEVKWLIQKNLVTPEEKH